MYLPGAHSPSIDVHEVGGWIEAHPSQPERERGVAQVDEGDVGEPNVDGLPLHVEATCSDAFAMMPKHLVGRGRAVAGNDLKRARAFDETSQVMKQVEQPGVDRMHFAGAEVAKNMIDGRQGVGQIRALAKIFDGEALTGMQVVEAQHANDRGSSFQARRTEHRKRYGDRRHEIASRDATHIWDIMAARTKDRQWR
jgi:hypothetical protein